ncbi:hypothetical protein WJX73_006715 [Symbiochloris irregularis]|uniref:Histone deacetylase domain-containing protein n=1 Tax=Symbiochloris irregularis TaxID=706552 RepID=A0AAW1PVY6_9CHLO
MDEYAFQASGDDSDEEPPQFLIHDAAASGQAVTLGQLLDDLAAAEEDAEDEGPSQLKIEVNRRDGDYCRPLNLALIGGHVDCVNMLLAAGANAQLTCEGSPPLHIATCLSGYSQHAAAALKVAKLLLECGADPFARDDHYRTALHWAALLGQKAMAVLLLEASIKHAAAAAEALAANGQADQLGKLLEMQDKQGNTALHLAAKASHCSVSLRAASPGSVDATDKRGRTPSQAATRRSVDLSGKEDKQLTMKGTRAPQTIIIAPDDCHNHLTCRDPITRRDSPPPPENVRRLWSLTRPGLGTLRSDEFEDVEWETECRPVAMGDVLRVHEWTYIRNLQQVCSSLPDSRDGIGALDTDTHLSHGSFRAALVAAGAVCRAIDAVMTGKARNVFCAVRPPGHHAGPSGIVPSAAQPDGSHGFCLINNVAVGGCYAANVYRHLGIRKIAILDFDVHHGNGTQACVASATPHIKTVEFRTPFSHGSQTFPIFRPWVDSNDADNIFFASVQGFGEDIYPGSGSTVDSRMPAAVPAEANGFAEANEGLISHDSVDDEFLSTTEEAAPAAEGPRIINVGIGLTEPAKWRRAWRDKILPALVQFQPDFILISAGFDAHKKDTLALKYVGIQEKDYEWVTDQIVQVANLCCNGRIVSVLEGGYRIQGSFVSAFARSVAAHVATLKQPHRQVWDAAEAAMERDREAQKRTAAAAAAAAADMPSDTDMSSAAGAGTALAAAEVGDGAGQGPATKRRRRGGPVDYVALNVQLEKEGKRS